jgi:hypothetical protein
VLILVPLILVACQPPQKGIEASEEWRMAGDASMITGNAEGGYNNYIRALNAWAGNTKARIGLADACRAFGNARFMRAQRWLETVKGSADPDNVKHAEQMAQHEFEEGMQLHRRAQILYGELLGKPPSREIYLKALHGLGRLHYDRISSPATPYSFADFGEGRAHTEKAIRHDRDQAILRFREFINKAPSTGVTLTYKYISTLLIARGRPADLNEAEDHLSSYEALQKIARKRAKDIRDPKAQKKAFDMIERELADIGEARSIIKAVRSQRK